MALRHQILQNGQGGANQAQHVVVMPTKLDKPVRSPYPDFFIAKLLLYPSSGHLVWSDSRMLSFT